MPSEMLELKAILKSLETLREEVAQLHQRVAALETAGAARPAQRSRDEDKAAAAPVAAAAPTAAAAEPIDEELILVISAAVAAYLGYKPRLRQIRLLGSTTWAQQGRATIQASHDLNPRHS